MSASNLRPWPKGVSGNPGGLSALPPELRAIKALSQAEVARIVARYARMQCSEMAIAMQDPAKLPALDAAIMRVFQEAITKGDFARLEFLLGRSIGKPAELAPVTTEDAVAREIADLTDEELRQRVLEAAKA